jgi:hypothetical protein
MAKILKCPSCQERIDVTDLSGGSTVRCEACGTMVRIASGSTGKVPQATPPPPPPPPAPARKERGTTKMHKKDKGTGVRTAPGRQTDLFRKMSNARSPGEGGRPRGGGGGGGGEQKGSNTGMIIAIAAAAIVIIGGVAFAVLHKSEPEHPKASAGKDRDSEKTTGTKTKKKKEDAPKASVSPTPGPSSSDTFKPGARAMAGVGKDVPDMKCNPDAKATYEGMVTGGKVAEVVGQDYNWITYIIDGLLSDNEAIAKGSMDALHQIILKRKLDARMSDLAKQSVIGGFNMPEMRSGEYTYWAQWWFTKSARDAVADWKAGAGATGGGGGDSPAPSVAAGNPATEPWEQTLRNCRSGGFSNSNNPEFYEFQKIKAMGKAAYPHLIRFIDNEDTSLGTTAVLILKELSGRSEAPGRVTEANKAKIKEDWEGWLRSGP